MKVFVCNDSSPELVEPQFLSFKKHLQEPFEMTLINSGAMAMNQQKSYEVTEVCNRLGIRVVCTERDQAIEAMRNDSFTYGHPDRIFQPYGVFTTPGNAGNYLMQWSWEKVVCREKESICFVHSDVFLIEPIVLSDYLEHHDICAVMPGKPAENGHPELKWLWEPIMVADMARLPQPETMIWWPSMVEGVWTDTGGRTYYYLRDHPEVRVLELAQSGCPNDDDEPTVDFHPARYRFIHLGNKRVLHYYSGSRWCTDSAHGWNWPKDKADEYHRRKMAWTKGLIGI